MSAATQSGLPSRVAIRWYHLAVIVLGLALAAVTALAVHLAVNDPTAAFTPGNFPAIHSAVVDEQPCYQPQRPC